MLLEASLNNSANRALRKEVGYLPFDKYTTTTTSTTLQQAHHNTTQHNTASKNQIIINSINIIFL